MIRSFETGSSQLGHRPSLLFREQPLRDPVIERLEQASIGADDFLYGQHYTDGVGLALVAQLKCGTADGKSSSGARAVSGLLKWRLKRAVDYIAAHLGEPIGFTEIAASTGLTRMHFAAQFRLSTGLRPREDLCHHRAGTGPAFHIGP